MKRSAILLAVLLALGISAYVFYRNHQVTGPLSGEQVARDVAGRRPIAVILDNYPDARPQAGLDHASLIYETLAEGGITRFLAVYQEQDAGMIGPVRSTRLYFNSWAAGLGVIFGHDGGNVDALQQLPQLSDVFNVDAGRAAGPFWRITTRAAPHNEYTSTDRLRSYAENHGGSTDGAPAALPHKGDVPASQRPSHASITVQFSSDAYAVTWRYDGVTNAYLREMGGAPHIDAVTGRQLLARNVVVMYTSESPSYDPFTPGSIHLKTEGSGDAVIYRDGTAVQGVWRKDSIAGSLQWLDRSGNPVALNPGPTWVEVVPAGTTVFTS